MLRTIVDGAYQTAFNFCGLSLDKDNLSLVAIGAFGPENRKLFEFI